MSSTSFSSSSQPKKSILPSSLKEISRKFDELFPELVKNLTENQPENTKDAQNWFKKVIVYNVPHGKKNRGLTVVHSYMQLSNRLSLDKVPPEDFLTASVLGWCIEFLQAFFLVSDDIMDNSITRRGQLCWFRNEGVGMVAINDCLYLESCVYQLLRLYLSNHPQFLNILLLFHDVTHLTITGQCLDILTSFFPIGEGNELKNFSKARHHGIVLYKTAFYSFYLPVACALYMLGIDDKKTHEEAKNILLKMGVFFQIQDDFLDCFGDETVTGKVGTDIEDNKCSWLVVMAMEKASEDELIKLKQNYGSKEKKNVDEVKNLYKKLELPKLYENLEEESKKEIELCLNKLPSSIPRQLIESYMEKIFKRKK